MSYLVEQQANQKPGRMTQQQGEAPVTVRTFAQRFSATRRGARLARILATHQLDAWGISYGSATSDTVALLVAELCANAVLHGSVPGRDVALRLAYDPATILVRIEVSDSHPGLPARAVQEAEAGAEADGGRGLALVEALAVQWGVSGRSGPGKTVWADVASRESADTGNRPTGRAAAGQRGPW